VHASVRDFEAYSRYLKARVLIYQQSPETLRAALAARGRSDWFTLPQAK
jgi:hypothetical protein